MLREQFQHIVDQLPAACRAVYGERLVSLALFGSVARGSMRPDSDIDLLVVARDLPRGRLPRVDEFSAVEDSLEPALVEAAAHDVHTYVAAIIKSPEEVAYGSPLLLDMTDQARILVDEDNFLAKRLQALAKRLEELGARRVAHGGGYYWLLKPDYQPGDTIEL